MLLISFVRKDDHGNISLHKVDSNNSNGSDDNDSDDSSNDKEISIIDNKVLISIC